MTRGRPVIDVDRAPRSTYRVPATPEHGFTYNTTPRAAASLLPGDRVTYALRGQLLAETVATAQPLGGVPGITAVRYVGRDTDCHYPNEQLLAVAR